MSYTWEYIMNSREADDYLITYPLDYYEALYKKTYDAVAMAGNVGPKLKEISHLRDRLKEISEIAESIRCEAQIAFESLWHQDVMKRNKLPQRVYGIAIRKSMCGTCGGCGGKRTGEKDVYASPDVGVEEWCDHCYGVGWKMRLTKIKEGDV